tara:strand:+ start:775 stop:1224 length:450 start_codon:yes stop_codon:yes gene_type:complete
MAIISSYPTVVPTADDLLIGTKVTNTGTVINPTKTFRAGEVVDASLGYTSYVATITQTGANPPVATVQKNNTGLTFTWQRASAGTYLVVPSLNFVVAKTWVNLTGGDVSTPSFLLIKSVTTGDINISNLQGSLTVDGIGYGAIEIRIYS